MVDNNTIYFFDTTLRDGEQSPGATMNLPEKLRLAHQLEELGVDVIEAGFPASSPGDLESVTAIAKEASRCTIAGLSRATFGDIDACWKALQYAKKPRIHTFIATSPLHMEYKLRKSPAEVIEITRKCVSHAAAYTHDVEFSAEDASRSDKDFLVEVFTAAIEAGACTINVPDTVGYAQPSEYAELLRYVIAGCPSKTPKGRPVLFSVHCHNDLGVAVANTLAALQVGVRQVEVTLGGIGERAGNAALEEVAMALKVRKDFYKFETNIVSEHLFPACRLLSRVIGQPIALNKPIVGANAFAHESGIHQDGVLKHRETYEIMSANSVGIAANALIIGKHSGKAAVKTKLESLGYSLTEDEVSIIFDGVKRLADKKKEIFDEDVEALVLELVFRIPDKYRLVHLSVQSSDTGVPPTAAVVLEVDGKERRQSGFGVGPVDAVFHVLAQLVHKKPVLEQYAVNAISGGTDAQGEVTVRLSEDGRMAVGRGADPDIIIASARAYINALNRLAKHQEEV